MNRSYASFQSVAEMDHSDNDCLVVVILTHGKIKDFNDDNSCNTLLNHDLMGYVHSKNGKYPLQDAWYYFTNESCPTLANKPRIFLIQACQGEKRENAFKLATIQVHKVKAPKQKSERTANFSFLPKQDFLVAYSSLPGHVSFRDAKQGSWFIQSFCDEMERRKPDDDLLTTLTLATQKVAHEFESNPGLKGNKQIPCIFSRLTKLIVFTKKPRAESHPMGWVQPIGWVYWHHSYITNWSIFKPNMEKNQINHKDWLNGILINWKNITIKETHRLIYLHFNLPTNVFVLPILSSSKQCVIKYRHFLDHIAIMNSTNFRFILLQWKFWK